MNEKRRSGWYVQCDAWSSPYPSATKEIAERRRDEINAAGHCNLPHRVSYYDAGISDYYDRCAREGRDSGD